MGGRTGVDQGLVFNIQRYSTSDGPGIRTTVFLKGCPLRCAWCHNPEGILPRPELLIREARCIRCGACREVCPSGTERSECTACGRCAEVCPTGARELAGRRLSVDQLVQEVCRDTVFFDESGGGVTFSGGEPLMQPDFLLASLEALGRREIRTAVDTCGYAPQAVLLEVAARCDVVLYDVKLMDDERHRRLTGVGNRRILSNLTALAAHHPEIWLRVPVVPGVNDDSENLEATARLVAAVPSVRRVCLLPYHRTALGKFEGLGRPYPLPEIRPPSGADLERLARGFEAVGVPVSIGG